MTKDDVRDTVLRLFREKDVFKDVDGDEDFFDLGVSSLTVVELQVLIEGALAVTVSTSKLMKSATINQWVNLYVGAAGVYMMYSTGNE